MQDARLGGYAGFLSARFFEERIFSEEAFNGVFKEAEDAEKLVGWSIWCRKYTLWRLIELYNLLGDEKILTGARRLADHLIDQPRRP